MPKQVGPGSNSIGEGEGALAGLLQDVAVILGARLTFANLITNLDLNANFKPISGTF
jgi:hypothetical protein